MMAAIGVEVGESGLMSAELISSLVVLLLLFIFLTGLCSDCNRRSFELQASEAEKAPSALIRVVKLEEVRENPTINEIQDDEKEFPSDGENPVSVTPWRSHLGAPQTQTESHSEEETSAPITPWRSHLGAPQSQDLNASDHHAITEGRGSNDASSPPANQQVDRPAAASSDQDRNAVYARVKKLSSNSPPVQRAEEEEEEEEASPPLPDRRVEEEG
ncbi:uncharacterized protein LOC114433130 isoform X2 [Parambassis ranga]|nr:uncharacterized protein LOC114433130 isoform X2 [Parambassis ranga]XP_028257291.1 uncharacterized protein LOC114433130 isoform X2 [Parambassis ranga]